MNTKVVEIKVILDNEIAAEMRHNSVCLNLLNSLGKEEHDKIWAMFRYNQVSRIIDIKALSVKIYDDEQTLLKMFCERLALQA